MDSRKTANINVIFSLLSQLVTMISGLIVPRLILDTFGSEINGLISSITQLLNYITLVEGGLGSVILSALYKAIADRNHEKISGIISATKLFFRNMGFIYAGYVVAISIAYPLIVRSSFSFHDVCLLVYILSISAFLHYMLSAPYRLLLIASQKGYITYIVQIAITLVNLAGFVIVIHVFPNIYIIKLVQGIVLLLQPLALMRYVKTHIKLDTKAEPDQQAISQRWDGFGQNFAFFIHTNTDIVILTLFASLETVSVYVVYMLAIKAVSQLIMSISSGFSPTMGKTLAEKKMQESNQVFDYYEVGIWLLSFIGFCSCIVLITPFVMLYTSNVTDVEYSRPVFGILMTLAEMVYCIRDPYISVIYNAGHFKQTSKYAYLEAVINIIISAVLVSRFGIAGVAIGTLLSMIFRMLFSVIYLKKHILYRNLRKFVKRLVTFIPSGALGIFLCHFIIPNHLNTIASFVLYGFVTTAVLGGSVLLVTYLVNRSELYSLYRLANSLWRKE